MNFNCYFRTERNHIVSFCMALIHYFSSLSQIYQVYKSAKFLIVKVTLIGSCERSVLFEAMTTLSFNSGSPIDKTIKGVFEDALEKESFSNLTENNTNFTITFVGK